MTRAASCLAVALLLAPVSGQQIARTDLLHPPRTELRWGIGSSSAAGSDRLPRLFLHMTAGTQVLRVSLPFAAEPGLEELRKLLMQDPGAGERHLDLAAALEQRARESRLLLSLHAARPVAAATLARDARFHRLEAERLLRNALETEPSEAGQLAYSRCLLALGRESEAHALIARLARSEPASWRALLRLAALGYRDTVGSVLPALVRGNLDGGPKLGRDGERRLALVERAIALAPDRPEPYLARFALVFDVGFGHLGPGATFDRRGDLLDQLLADVRDARARAGDRVDLVAWSHVIEAILIVVRRAVLTFGETTALPDPAARDLPAAILEFAARMTSHARPDEAAALREADRFLEGLEADPDMGNAARVGRLFVAFGAADWPAVTSRLAGLRGRLPDLDTAIETILLITGPLKELEGDAVDPDRVRAVFERIHAEATTFLPHFVAATWACKRGLFEPGVREYRIAVSKAPQVPDAWVGLGVSLLRTGGDLEESRVALERACRHANTVDAEAAVSAVAHHGLGVIAASQGRWRDAADHYETAGQLDPEHPGVRREHADALRELARSGARPELLRASLSTELHAAELFVTSHRRQTASPGRPPPFDALAEAAACLRRAADLEGRAGLTPEDLRRVKVERLAVAAQLAGATASPAEQREVTAELSTVLAEMGDGPRTAEDSFLLARLLASLGGDRLDEALASAQDAVRRSLGRDPEHLVLVGHIHQMSGRTDEAIAALERALEVFAEMFGEAQRPEGDRAERMLLALYHRASRWAELVVLSDRRAARFIASRTDLIYAAGLHLQPTGVMKSVYDPEKARDYALRATRLGLGALPEATMVLSFALYRCGDLERSLELAGAALAENRAVAAKAGAGAAEDAGSKAFYQQLSFLLATDPDGGWARRLRGELLHPAELQRLAR